MKFFYQRIFVSIIVSFVVPFKMEWLQKFSISWLKSNFQVFSIQFRKFESHTVIIPPFRLLIISQFIILLYLFSSIFNRDERNCTIWSHAKRFYYCKRSKTYCTWQPCCAILVQSAITVLISVATKYSSSRRCLTGQQESLLPLLLFIPALPFVEFFKFLSTGWNFILFIYLFFPIEITIYREAENVSLLSS